MLPSNPNVMASLLIKISTATSGSPIGIPNITGCILAVIAREGLNVSHAACIASIAASTTTSAKSLKNAVHSFAVSVSFALFTKAGTSSTTRSMARTISKATSERVSKLSARIAGTATPPIMRSTMNSFVISWLFSVWETIPFPSISRSILARFV